MFRICSGVATEKKYEQPDMDERLEIYKLHGADKLPGEVAHLTERSAFTIGCERR